MKEHTNTHDSNLRLVALSHLTVLQNHKVVITLVGYTCYATFNNDYMFNMAYGFVSASAHDITSIDIYNSHKMFLNDVKLYETTLNIFICNIIHRVIHIVDTPRHRSDQVELGSKRWYLPGQP
jgi:hypothetical protein